MTDRPPHASHHCHHYEYVRAAKDYGPKCAVGIDLQNGVSVAACMPDAPVSVAASAQCAWREEHTDEERAAWKAWQAERQFRMFLVLAEIPGSSRDKKNKPFWGQRGEFECPACKADDKSGTVRWARAPSNGHVRAACTTPDCCEFME